MRVVIRFVEPCSEEAALRTRRLLSSLTSLYERQVHQPYADEVWSWPPLIALLPWPAA